MRKRRKVLAVGAQRGEHEEAAEDDDLERERQEAVAAARRAGTARGVGSGPTRGARGGGGGRRRQPRARMAGGGGGCPEWGRRDGKRYSGGQRWCWVSPSSSSQLTFTLSSLSLTLSLVHRELMIGPAAVSFGGVGDGDRLRMWHRSRGGRRTKTVAALPQSGHIFFCSHRLTFVVCCHQ
jgi:hypothetical protein